MPESITGFCLDARLITPGECLIALSYGSRDGHDIVQQALDKMATVLCYSKIRRPWHCLRCFVKDSLVAMGAMAVEDTSTTIFRPSGRDYR